MNAFDAIGAKGRINIRTAANDGVVHIQKHEGEIEVNSEVGRGTEFRIRLAIGPGGGADSQPPVVS